MMLERIEIAITMKQLVALGDAEGSDQRINRRPHSNAFSPQEAIIARRCSSDLVAADVAKIKLIEALQGASGVNLGAEALQYLSEDQVPDQQPPRTHQLIKQVASRLCTPLK